MHKTTRQDFWNQLLDKAVNPGTCRNVFEVDLIWISRSTLLISSEANGIFRHCLSHIDTIEVIPF